jgi:hypothetical protein
MKDESIGGTVIVVLLTIVTLVTLLGLLVYIMGYNSGYKDGQIDALNGNFKYVPATQPQYHSGNVKGTR